MDGVLAVHSLSSRLIYFVVRSMNLRVWVSLVDV